MERFIQKHPAEAKKLLREFYLYLYTYNILPCDLTPANMVIAETVPGVFRFILLDGLGCTDGIKLAQYVKFLGRLKIKRKFKRLLLSPNIRQLFNGEAEIKTFLNLPKCGKHQK